MATRPATIRPNAIERHRAPDRVVHLVDRRSEGWCSGGGPDERWLALIDVDRDGSIDDHETWDVIEQMLFRTGGDSTIAEFRAQIPPPPRK